MLVFMIVSFIVQVLMKSQLKPLVNIIYSLQFSLALSSIKFATPAIADMFFEQFDHIYQFAFCNLEGFIKIFDKDFRLD